jgi:hypothetical protein
VRAATEIRPNCTPFRTAASHTRPSPSSPTPPVGNSPSPRQPHLDQSPGGVCLNGRTPGPHQFPTTDQMVRGQSNKPLKRKLAALTLSGKILSTPVGRQPFGNGPTAIPLNSSLNWPLRGDLRSIGVMGGAAKWSTAGRPVFVLACEMFPRSVKSGPCVPSTTTEHHRFAALPQKLAPLH